MLPTHWISWRGYHSPSQVKMVSNQQDIDPSLNEWLRVPIQYDADVVRTCVLNKPGSLSPEITPGQRWTCSTDYGALPSLVKHIIDVEADTQFARTPDREDDDRFSVSMVVNSDQHFVTSRSNSTGPYSARGTHSCLHLY
jgi:hypothetical protein